MIQSLDYQIVVNMVGITLGASIFPGVVCALAERLANMIISAVGGEKRVRL